MDQAFIDTYNKSVKINDPGIKSKYMSNRSLRNIVFSKTDEKEEGLEEYMFLTNQYKEFDNGHDGFSINRKHLYFWNNF